MQKQKRVSPEEKKVFTKLEIEDEETKRLICAQRRVNGQLCRAIWAILVAVEHHSKGIDPDEKGRSLEKTIKHARKLILNVAEEPPGCNPKNPRT